MAATMAFGEMFLARASRRMISWCVWIQLRTAFSRAEKREKSEPGGTYGGGRKFASQSS